MRDRIMGMNDGGAGRDEPEELPFFFCFFFLVNISVSETTDYLLSRGLLTRFTRFRIQGIGFFFSFEK